MLKVSIVGGRSWATKELLHVLKKVIGPHQLDIYGSSNYLTRLEWNQPAQVLKWDGKIADGTDFFFPFAFLTADKKNSMTQEEYISENRRLIQQSQDAIEKYAPKHCLLLSSGEVSNREETSARSVDFSLYRDLKSYEEKVVSKACQESGTKLIIVRVFSVSGRFVTKPQTFAFSNFIYQAINSGEVKIETSKQTFRRYMAFGQLLEMSLKEVVNRNFGLLESGGDLVELHDLAERVAVKFGARYVGRIESSDYERYHSRRNDFEALAKVQNVILEDLDSQIDSCARSMMVDSN